MDGKSCYFKIVIGIKVSISYRKLIKEEKEKIRIKDCNLKYLSDEKVRIKFKVVVKIQLEKYFIEIPMFVSKINNDCLLSVDFLRFVNLENIFEFTFGISKLKSPEQFSN